jgi:crotonobetaine/carnitine-CoA ligase
MSTAASASQEEDRSFGCARNAGLLLPAVLARRATETPDAPFLTEVAGRSLSYQQTWQEIRRWMATLAQIGIRPGEPVASFLPHSADAQLLWLANALLGARHVPVNPQLRGEFLRHVLTDAQVRRAFVRPEQVGSLIEAGLPHDIELIETGTGGSRWDRLLGQAQSAAEPALPAAGEVAT